MPPTEFTSTPAPHPAAAVPTDVCLRTLALIADGNLADFEALIHPEAVNREAAIQPSATRGRGPAAFHATALWLRSALSGMRWEINEVVADGDIVAVHATATARHAGPFIFYDQAGAVRQVFPPTGKASTVTQTHWFKVADGKIIEHWANRDDMAMAQQFGWIPPRPTYLIRMALAKRQARARAKPACFTPVGRHGAEIRRSALPVRENRTAE